MLQKQPCVQRPGLTPVPHPRCGTSCSHSPAVTPIGIRMVFQFFTFFAVKFHVLYQQDYLLREVSYGRLNLYLHQIR